MVSKPKEPCHKALAAVVQPKVCTVGTTENLSGAQKKSKKLLFLTILQKTIEEWQMSIVNIT